MELVRIMAVSVIRAKLQKIRGTVNYGRLVVDGSSRVMVPTLSTDRLHKELTPKLRDLYGSQQHLISLSLVPTRTNDSQ